MASNHMIEQKIEELLREYRSNPTLALRESTIQAQLYGKLCSAFGTTPAMVNNHHIRTVFPTNRVALELKVMDKLQRSDIVVFADRNEKNPILLQAHKNGVFDILASVAIDDVDAVIEIKAAPSKNSSEAMCDDVLKLLQVLKKQPKLHAYFVNIDKSVPVNPYSGTHGEQWWTGLREITLTTNEPTNTPSVQIWDLWGTHYERDTKLFPNGNNRSDGIVKYYAL